LEEFLDTFPGCLIIVSHDRYFMDRLVEHLFVFEGEGKIKDFPGNYTDFREWEKEQKLAQKTEKPERTIAEPIKSQASKVKASFKDKKEFEDLSLQIEKLNQEKAELVGIISAGSVDHENLVNWSRRIQEIEGLLEEMEMRWLELSELDGIE